MATTRVVNMIVPAVFSPYTVEQTAELSELMQAGIIERHPAADRLAAGGGQTVNLPFYKEITGDSKLILDDGSVATPQAINAGQDTAALNNRFEAWGGSQLAKWASGDDPLGRIATMVGGWWARAFQRFILKILLGLFDNTNGVLRISHRLNIYTDIASPLEAAKLHASTFADGTGLLGDNSQALEVVAMHSEVETSLRKRELVQDFQPSGLTKRIPIFNGRRVIVDDGCPKTAGANSPAYMTYVFGRGAFQHGLDETDPEDMTETDRAALQHEGYLVTRRRFILHPTGVRWIGAPALPAGPSDAELIVGTNYAKVYADKNIRIVAIRHNI